jgi:hypothetical protein
MAIHVSARRALLSLAGSAVCAGVALGAWQAGGPLGIGRVFFPNPVATLQDQSLTDRKDADYPGLEPAYRQVVLTNLDGSGFLRGDWANVVSETGPPAFSPDNIFLFSRHDDRFEQVMAYYWAVTVSNVIAPTADPACVADWDSTSYTRTVPHCLRRVDDDLHYPENLTGEIYRDGLIWSRALWDIRHALGHVKADTVILEGIFGYDPYVTMPEAADATVKAAERLYGKATAKAVATAFQARGILP